jgi:hypothetical protein
MRFNAPVILALRRLTSGQSVHLSGCRAEGRRDERIEVRVSNDCRYSLNISSLASFSLPSPALGVRLSLRERNNAFTTLIFVD